MRTISNSQRKIWLAPRPIIARVLRATLIVLGFATFSFAQDVAGPHLGWSATGSEGVKEALIGQPITYTRRTGTGEAIVPGTTLIEGSVCDDCVNPVDLPFTFSFYGMPFTSVNVSSNGNLQFSSSSNSTYSPCLPSDVADNVILAYWDDLLSEGTYTSTTGSEPHRIFNIEWRGGYYNGGGTANFEVRLYEGSNRIDFVYGTVEQGGENATVGIQRGTGEAFNEFSCYYPGSVTSGLRVTYIPNSLTAFDFDGDGRSDVSVFRPSDSIWYLNRSSQGFSAVQFGLPIDKIVPADYDGDGKTDIAIYRDGTWWLLQSTNGVAVYQFGIASDIPVPADYTGDGHDEIAVYRSGQWWMLDLTNGQASVVNFGKSTDKPVPADYDGDGRVDQAVYRDGEWHLNRSSQGPAVGPFGLASDIPLTGDFDGDGKADLAVYRDGTWWILRSQDGGSSAIQWGVSTDIPAPADYDGDGKTDLAVYRDGQWWMLQSTAGAAVQQFGLAGDKPAPAAYLP